MAKNKQAMRKRASCDVRAATETQSEARSKADDGLSILPPSMQEHVIASLNRNREAFRRLAKL